MEITREFHQISTKNYVLLKPSSCHIQFTYAFSALRCIFEEITLPTTAMVSSSNTHCYAEIAWETHCNTSIPIFFISRCNFEKLCLPTECQQNLFCKQTILKSKCLILVPSYSSSDVSFWWLISIKKFSFVIKQADFKISNFS